MPTPCYLSIEGKTQGNITAGAFTGESVGNIFVEGHEDEVLIQAVSHLVDVPTDPQNGQPSGQRVHGPLQITCSFNKSVPLMYNALVSGEILTQVELSWYRTSVEGKQEHFFSTKLEDAVITSIDLNMPHCQLPATRELTQLLTANFSYRKIIWEHIASGTSGSDDWRSPIEE